MTTTTTKNPLPQQQQQQKQHPPWTTMITAMGIGDDDDDENVLAVDRNLLESCSQCRYITKMSSCGVFFRKSDLWCQHETQGEVCCSGYYYSSDSSSGAGLGKGGGGNTAGDSPCCNLRPGWMYLGFFVAAIVLCCGVWCLKIRYCPDTDCRCCKGCE